MNPLYPSIYSAGIVTIKDPDSLVVAFCCSNKHHLLEYMHVFREAGLDTTSFSRKIRHGTLWKKKIVHLLGWTPQKRIQGWLPLWKTPWQLVNLPQFWDASDVGNDCPRVNYKGKEFAPEEVLSPLSMGLYFKGKEFNLKEQILSFECRSLFKRSQVVTTLNGN